MRKTPLLAILTIFMSAIASFSIQAQEEIASFSIPAKTLISQNKGTAKTIRLDPATQKRDYLSFKLSESGVTYKKYKNLPVCYIQVSRPGSSDRKPLGNFTVASSSILISPNDVVGYVYLNCENPLTFPVTVKAILHRQ